MAWRSPTCWRGISSPGPRRSRGPEFNGGVHHVAKAKRIIQLFMNGGVSQMDTFDYKPDLVRFHGQMTGPKEKPEGFTAEVGAVMKSPFEFKAGSGKAAAG